jgi:transcriptional regulator with XRE-family HTH domain
MAKHSQRERSEINKRMMTVIREQGVTQADLVRATGATSPTVTDWFNKGAVPDAATLARVARHLRLNGHWLLTGEGSPLAPGEGETQTDVAFALGARTVLTELRRVLATLEVAYFGDRATSLDEAALAAMKVIERTGALRPQTRRQAR